MQPHVGHQLLSDSYHNILSTFDVWVRCTDVVFRLNINKIGPSLPAL